MQPEGQWDLSNPVLISPNSDQSNIILNEATPNETITFNWEAAISSAGYGVTYEVLLDTLGTTDFSNPILKLPSSNNGKGTSLSISYETLDLALAYSGFTANTSSDITYAIKASSLSKSSLSSQVVSIFRFENEITPSRLFLSGTGAENNNVISDAIAFKRLTDSNNIPSNVHEVYTSLVAGEPFKIFSERFLPSLQFGGSNGVLERFGDGIVAEFSGPYRVQIDLDNNTYNLLKIDFWSMVGSPINGGWGGDEPLEYIGDGIWKSTINLINTGGFAFRANGDWSYLLKRVVGSNNQLVLESDAPSQGLSFEDIPSNQIGLFEVTLDLSSDGYNFTFEEDTTVVTPVSTPQQLFLFENGIMIEELTKNGDVFSSTRFIPMQASMDYSLNSVMDGSGVSYSVNSDLADSLTPDGDSVTDTHVLLESSSSFRLTNDRALSIVIDFSLPQLSWKYYNFKLFHWQIWDNRVETLMTYSHPNTFTTNADLTSGFDSKFISPFDFDLGSDNPSALSGNLINGGGSNLLNITVDRMYQVTIVLQDDYQTGTYDFQ
ncbi:SusE domain-containing protein [Nonlabens sp.]|uniref:SusE domain-containing protein n=1 Tax=Nonlabens sp. TaxID=1888209 RepID=UPI003F69C51C